MTDCTYPSILVIILAVAIVLVVEIVSDRRRAKRLAKFQRGVNNPPDSLDKRV